VTAPRSPPPPQPAAPGSVLASVARVSAHFGGHWENVHIPRKVRGSQRWHYML
jgi:hypothetical protein